MKSNLQTIIRCCPRSFIGNDESHEKLGQDSTRGLLCRDAANCCGRIPTFRRTLLPPSSGSQPRRPRFESSPPSPLERSCDSSVGIALGYGLDDRGSSVRFPAGAGNFSLHPRVQNGSGAHPASYPMGSRVSFPGGKAGGT
jgi:hypothetical protein